MIKQGNTRKILPTLVLVAALLFPSVSSAAWVYVSDTPTTILWAANTGGASARISYSTATNSYWFVHPTGYYWMDSNISGEVYFNGTTVSNTMPAGLPAPAGFYTQEEYDLAASGASPSVITSLSTTDALICGFFFMILSVGLLAGMRMPDV